MNEYILEFNVENKKCLNKKYFFNEPSDDCAECHVEDNFSKEELVGAVLRRVTEIKDY